MADDERYDDREVEEILRRAAVQREGLEHSDLVDAAVEAGIDPRAVERAAESVRRERSTKTKTTERKTRATARFIRHLTTFGIVNVFLFLIDVLTPGGWWFMWPLLGWGLFVALHGAGLLGPEEEPKPSRRERRRNAKLEDQAERQRAKEAAKQATKARLKKAETAFEDAVERGLSRVLEQVADGLDSLATPKSEPTSSEFGSYVASQRGDTAGSSPTSARPAPAVRVEDAPRPHAHEAVIDSKKRSEREA